ncbi:hypothetical protein N665_0906s0005 [Sinapis alba]|nr:hypothetical protein N665_0906s0005 [Sinapis alba]
MTHSYQEMKDMKKLKQHYDMLGFVPNAQYGILTRCPCGGEIKQDVSLDPKYLSYFDTLPRRRYFTCKKFEDNDMHFRHPWTFGVEKEVKSLRRQVDNMAEEIAKLKSLITRP